MSGSQWNPINWPKWQLCLLAFACLFAIYRLSPMYFIADSRYSIHTAVSFMRGDWGSLAYFSPSDYHMLYISGQPFNFHPMGASLISIPLVFIGTLIDHDLIAHLRNDGHSKFEFWVSSFWAAMLGAVFLNFLITYVTDRKSAIVTAGLLALGSFVWSQAALSLWQHGPLMLTHAITLHLLFGAERDDRLAKYVSLPLAVGFIIRPTAAIPIAIFSLYVLFRHRAKFPAYMALAALIAVPWIAYNYVIYDAMMPPAYFGRGLFAWSYFREGLLGGLISPSRGLLVFSPVVAFAVPGFLIAWRTQPYRRLLLCIVAILACHWLLVSGWIHWWGGHTYGPRMLSDILPFLFLFVAYYVAHLFQRQSASGRRIRLQTWVFAAAAAWSVFVQAHAAFRPGPFAWNVLPVDVDKEPDRVWDWTDPPFFRFRDVDYYRRKEPEAGASGG